ncbi:tetratricopeptide repeat protein [Candidatus Pelagibacter communis]|uniref:tetratricopeptide repeat protein n=1 Tax=Pelagibacter ubique TaxID=198252 RepID=UPI00094D88C8|nr:tetratricopeptide repeat protein [Candidatus Pelagibacter ubique]|tara:strand:- start:145 stop:687 length:543 start_codon:yes stop_codon:yes gene_type:complete
MRRIIIFVLFITTGVSIANERDIKLDRLFDDLKNLNSKLTYETEQQIWKIWSTHPTDQKLTTILNQGSELVLSQKYVEAVHVFSKIIKLDPTWAEAWNKRATVLYLLGDYEGSQRDINEVLKLESRHFGALSGQGLVNIKLKNYEKAIKSYQQALEIYPSMKSHKIMIKQIEELIQEELI